MTTRALPFPATKSSALFVFGDHSVTLSATSPAVMAAVAAVLRPSLREDGSSEPVANVSLRADRDGWQLEVDGVRCRELSQRTPVPRLVEEIISAACHAVAAKAFSIVLRAPVLSKDGAAVALVGDDIESAKVIAFHLHARGWSALTFGYSFVSLETLHATALRSLMSVSSTSIDQIPPRYKAAIEASLWYDSGIDLTFYTVDPLIVRAGSDARVALTHVLVIDGALDDAATIETVDRGEIGWLGGHRSAAMLHAGRLTLASPIASSDAIEHWVRSGA